MTDSERIAQLEAKFAQLEARIAYLESPKPTYVPNPAFPDIGFSGYKITCGTAQLQNEYSYK